MVGARRCVRMLVCLHELCEELGFSLAHYGKWQGGGAVKWLGANTSATLGMLWLPRDKQLRAMRQVREARAGVMSVGDYVRFHGFLEHLAYASSSSVYGGNTKLPFSEHDSVDHPVSLYAATKKANELMAHTYSHLYGIPTTGLRFFTVYGPWGRPDMALFLFAKAMLKLGCLAHRCH